MKPFIYPISEILIQPDYSERKVMIEANIQKLMLGPIQSKRYYESVAIIRQNYSAKHCEQALNTLKRYHNV